MTIVTAVISSVEDWQKYIVYTDATKSIDGYYVLGDHISASTTFGTSVRPNNASNDMSVGFVGVLDGRNHTITLEKDCLTGVGIFGVLGSGAVVKNLNIVSNTGKAPDWNSNAILGLVATKTRIENVKIEINNANHTSGARYGALTQEGLVGCTFINVEFAINGKVQSLSGGSSNVLSLTETTFADCLVSFTTEGSSLDEVGHNGSNVYVYKGANTDNGKISLVGIKLKTNGSGEYLAKDGKSDYVVVLPKDSSVTLKKAANELVKYFAEATGVSLDVTDDSVGITHGNTQTYLSLGITSLYNSADIADVTLKTNGYRLYTKDNNVYITGGSDKGVLYGVYGLLGDLFGLEFYSEDCYEMSKANEVTRQNYDTTFSPSIDFRGQTGIVLGTEEKYTSYADHLQINDYIWARLMPIVNAADDTKTDYGHNGLYYLPPSLYKTSHSSFYSNRSTWEENDWGGVNAQLCFTARGNSGEYSTMVRLCAERIENSLKKYASNKTYDSVMLGIEDNYYTCNCSACTNLINRYGSIAATIVLFLDDVADEVESWMSQNTAYRRDLQYMFFAYQSMLKAPGEMPAVKNKIIPLVALSEMNYAVAPTDTTVRTTSMGSISNNMILGWAKQWGEFAARNGGNAWVWTYGNFYRDYFVFYDSYVFYAEIFKYLGDYGYGQCYVQQQSKQRNAYTAFYSLNQYVTAKLAADNTLNINDLIDGYMSAMYKDAAPYMKTLFENWKTIFANNFSSFALGYDGKVGAKLLYADLSGKLLDVLDSAYKAIAKYENTDPNLYAAIKRRIDLEWLAPAKIALVDSNAIKDIADQKTRYENIRTKFKQIVEETGISAASEFKGIQSLIDEINSVTL